MKTLFLVDRCINFPLTYAYLLFSRVLLVAEEVLERARAGVSEISAMETVKKPRDEKVSVVAALALRALANRLMAGIVGAVAAKAVLGAAKALAEVVEASVETVIHQKSLHVEASEVVAGVADLAAVGVVVDLARAADLEVEEALERQMMTMMNRMAPVLVVEDLVGKAGVALEVVVAAVFLEVMTGKMVVVEVVDLEVVVAVELVANVARKAILLGSVPKEVAEVVVELVISAVKRDILLESVPKAVAAEEEEELVISVARRDTLQENVLRQAS